MEEIHLDRDVFVPDVAGWTRERVPERPTDKYWDIVPDWICEVVLEPFEEMELPLSALW
ncbi:MAG TPA: hypothetical protein VJZ00_06170 [Thermoanaerobaculia bacterium]|nr:hypothetical protein [Thermoanaerobaculia bacterium]